MKRVILTSLVLVSCSTFKVKEHKFISFVFDNSKDTIQVENVTEYKNYYILKDKSKIEKSKVVWSRVDQEKRKSWKEIQKEKRKKANKRTLKAMFKMTN